jgi:peptidyl-prolyl cis-trans isomerase A (cyclophilin A)
MRRLTALLLLTAGCAGGGAASPAAPAGRAPDLMNPADPELSKTAPAVFRVRFELARGAFTVEARRDAAPKGADRFYNLVRAGFYDGTRIFRVVPGFVLQFGLPKDPAVAATWREARIGDDPVRGSNTRGTMTFATAGPNTRTTQLFINFKDNPRLDRMGFAPFARVVEGMEVVDAVNAEYGERPQQDRIQAEGEAYLGREFPRLDLIRSAKVLE